jgi:hypothetical protein
MRTTIRLPETQKERLLKIAADRGDKGCARVVQEAVAHYLAERERGPQPPPLRADTRTERVALLLGWIWEEAAGLVGAARTFRARLRGYPAN